MQTTPAKTIIVDARSFDLYKDFEDGDFKDGYIARFLNEAISDGYEIKILVDGEELTLAAESLERAAQICADFLSDDVDSKVLKEGLFAFYQDEPSTGLIKEDTANPLPEKPPPFSGADLIISPDNESGFGALFTDYIQYKSPEDLNSINAYEEFKGELESVRRRKEHYVETVRTEIEKQLDLIAADVPIRQAFGLSAQGKGLETLYRRFSRNEAIDAFNKGQPLTIPHSGSPDKTGKAISEGHYLLTLYFANTMRRHNKDSLGIDEEYQLEQELLGLADDIMDMKDGEEALAQVDTMAMNLLFPQPKNTR